MGPGPSDVAPSVLQAMSRPTLGHLDPRFLEIMDETAAMLRAVLGTENRLTLPISGTGSAGMETCLVNLLEPGDRALIGVNGVFGTRMCEVARRCGAEVTPVEARWGEAMSTEALRAAAGGRAYKLVAVVHAETSTGALQPLAGLRELADELGALLMIDAVTSTGGVPVDLDDHGVDAMYGGTQKCLSAPPGLAPVSFSDRAVAALQDRKSPVQSWYLDLSLITKYWGGERAYHHTAPVNSVYALHEALRLVLEEGLEARYARHARHGASLAEGLEGLGLSLPVAANTRMPQLTVVSIPDGVQDKAVRAHLLEHLGLEIGGGLGPMAGKVWRIGLMGSACTERNVTLCVAGLEQALAAQA